MNRHITRDYSSDEVTVHWDNSKCVHCGKCVLGLPSVFNLNNHPWVDVHGATADEIVAQVEKCPSGALTFTRN